MAQSTKVTAKAAESKKVDSVSRTQEPQSSRSENSTVEQILNLHRTIGNQAVQRLIKSGTLQAKLKIGQPGDVYEQEADRLAEQVMRMAAPPVQRQPDEEEKNEEDEEIQTKPLGAQITPLVQRQIEEEEEEEDTLRAKEASSQSSEVAPDVQTHLDSAGGGGQPLPDSARAYFEPRFGHDLSQVRVHSDADAAAASRQINAQAFTRGRDVFFGTGKYQPETTSGKHLLAHELTHVVQQRSARARISANFAQAKPVQAVAAKTVAGERSTNEHPDATATEQMTEKTVTETKPTAGVSSEATTETQSVLESPPEHIADTTVAGGPEASAEKKPLVSVSQNGEKQKAETPAGKGKGIGGEQDVATGAPLETATVSATAEDPGQIIEQLRNVSPVGAVAAYGKAQEASAVALEAQQRQLEQSLPEIAAPTGLPAKKARDEKTRKVAAGPEERLPSRFAGEESGKEGERYDTQVEDTAPARPVTPTLLTSGAVGDSGENDAELSRSAQNSLDDVQMDASQISTSSGERPSVDVTGEADPSQLSSFQAESSTRVRTAKAKASREIYQDFGENDLFPESSNEKLKASKALSSPKTPSTKGGEVPSIPAEAIGGLNESLGPILSERIGEQKAKYDTGKKRFDADTAQARTDADEQMAKLDQEAREKQIDEQNKAKTEVAQSRVEWQTELDNLEQDYLTKANKAGEAQREKIVKEKEKGEEKAARHLQDAEKKAGQKKLNAEKEANQKKEEAKEESGGFWGWVKSAASALIDGLKKAVNFIYDNLRKAVKLIFETAKKLVQGVIELARMAIVGLIKAYGAILKGLVSVVFAAFPDIANRINSKIDRAVDTAVKAVNKVAEFLKKAVAAVLDFLANILDSLLGLIQSLYNGIFTVIGMIIRGEFKELIERIGALVDAAKEMPSHLEGAVWEQLIGVDISKPMPGEVGYVPPEGTAGTASAPSEAAGELGLTGNDIAVEPIATEEFEPELIEDLGLEDGEEKVIGERSGDAYTISGVLADFQQAEPGLAPGASPRQTKESEITPAQARKPAMGRAERAAKVWDQIKTFMGNWLSENWGKLLLAVIGALVGLIAATIVTGGAILAALPIIMKIVAAIFIGLAIMKAMEYLKTYLSQGWAKKVGVAAKALANAIAVGIVELAMALGFRAIGVGLKAAGKAVKAGAKLAVTGVKRGAAAAAAGVKSLLKSGANLVSRSGSAFIRNGKLIFKGLRRGFARGITKTKDMVKRLFERFRIKRISIERRGRVIYVFGHINPRFLITTIKGVEFELERRGSPKTSKLKLEKEFPSAKVKKIRADAPHKKVGNPKLGKDPRSHADFGPHTFTKHGPGGTRTNKLKELAKTNGPQGQFRSADDIVKAEKLTPLERGTHVVEMPGDVILPSGDIVPTPYTVVVRLANGSVKTAYPARAKEIAHFVGKNI